MDANIKAKWLTALRSGEYTQGQAVLRTETNKFCCLGVLCDLAVKEEVAQVITRSDADVDAGIARYAYGNGGGDVQTGVLPLTVALWAGLDQNPMVTVEEGIHRTLSALNDKGETFEVIADLIEESL